ncbi:molybdopterin-synthase adenylyltransferase MoeB [Kineosporia sp. NBRC 101731]|uniref:molybdopterin-synthase adenylyltransferase MoeB n=1 Tax=Kineosporia sp. NBRC 101731 TaxID=3032199 RepID=UPI0024A2DEC1|nr:molybdopterin-synthase adenylyltransferase MoeB [Kineosporia sp. NBRC 101731]GLY33862.1 molybdopterin biosynthesis protein MoeZ [Kineosporia sp. NBRC 101731]
MTSTLSADELHRYSRHISIDSVGVDGQSRLKAARILVVGAGGLGSPTLMYLAAAGVGVMGIVDDDVVERSNLQRQVIHGESTMGTLKVESASRRMKDINPLVEVRRIAARLTAANCLDILRDYDVVIDGSDNFPTRYLVNDACHFLGIPCVWGSVFQFTGQASVFNQKAGPCYRCLYPQAPPPELAPSCAEGGVFGALCASVAAVQATEAIKLVLGHGRPLVGRLWLYDGSEAETQVLKVHKDPQCPLCGSAATITDLTDLSYVCAAPVATPVEMISPETLAQRLERRHRDEDDFLLLDVREQFEWDIVHIDGARLVPQGQVPAQSASFPADREIIVYCKSGGRSEKVARSLKRDFARVLNLDGGVLAWAAKVDPSLPVY